MDELNLSYFKNELLERKEKLKESLKFIPESKNLIGLLHEVDSALKRIDKGIYGICNVCRDPIETDRLIVDPLITFCIDHLNEKQRRALEDDIQFAAKIQRGLLPQNNISLNGWEFSYSYNPSASVSGDFCDFIPAKDNSILFALGDVSGKGIPASLMMSHIHALLRSLLTFDLPVNEIVKKSNRLFCESAVSSNYATMVFGKASPNGEVEICVAGHNPPMFIQNGELMSIKATGIPIGLFCNSEYDVVKLKLEKDDLILLYTDGLTEASYNNIEYGVDRLQIQLMKTLNNKADTIIQNLIKDQKGFLQNIHPSDDITVAVIKRQ